MYIFAKILQIKERTKEIHFFFIFLRRVVYQKENVRLRMEYVGLLFVRKLLSLEKKYGLTFMVNIWKEWFT
jgi:hypothetical protein